MIWWMIAAFCAYFVKGLCGFANTLVFTGILSFTAGNISISPVDLLLGYAPNAIIAWRERRHIDLRLCIPPTLFIIIGSIPGIILLKNTDATVVKILFGAVTVLVGVRMLMQELSDRRRSRQSPAALAIIGILSGILCGMYGIGALLGAYLGRATDDIHEFRGNICLIFLIENTARLIMYCAAGIITRDIALRAVMLIPAVLAGLGAGIVCSRYIRDSAAKRSVIVMLIASGIALIVTNAINITTG